MVSTDERADLDAAVYEQVMRTSSDIADCSLVAAAVTGALSIHAAVGRLIDGCALDLGRGTPAHAWVTGGLIDPGWRDRCPAGPSSLWDSLRFLRSVTSTSVVFTNPFEELQELSAQLSTQ